ncbi:MAG TPA: LPS export ABC transporter periplasmic protein LptC [Ignavibacteriaceae bacterium]|nr:LPS export ABC transporter periplasmic protein LptC [Ignavibacteriaceae bacterium]
MRKLFFCVSLLIVTSCSDEKIKPLIDPSLKIEELPAQESWDATVFFSDSGKTTAVLKAGHLRMFSERKETLLDNGIQVDFYSEDEIKTTTLTAKRGRVDDATRDLYANENVVVKSDSTTIETDELKWRNSDKKIVSDKFVTIISPKEKIQGYGFESDQHLQNYVIYNITYVTRRDSL